MKFKTKVVMGTVGVQPQTVLRSAVGVVSCGFPIIISMIISLLAVERVEQGRAVGVSVPDACESTSLIHTDLHLKHPRHTAWYAS